MRKNKGKNLALFIEEDKAKMLFLPFSSFFVIEILTKLNFSLWKNIEKSCIYSDFVFNLFKFKSH